MKYFFSIAFVLILQQAHTQCSTIFFDGFESGDFVPTWNTGTGYTSAAVTSSPVASGNYAFTMTGGTNTHLTGISTSIAPSTPSTVSWDIYPTGTASGNYVVIGDGSVSATNCMVFFYFLGSGSALRFVSSSTTQVPVTTNQWYHISLENINYVARTFDIYVNGVLQATSFPFRSSTISNLSAIHLYNFNNTTAYWDNITLGSSAVQASALTSDVTCNGASDGAIDLSVSGGNGTYTYNWSNASTNEDLSNIPASDYTVVVTDGLGCTDTVTTTVSEPAAIESSFSATNCETYTWNGVDYTSSGNYQQVFPATNGCDSTVTLNLTILQPTTSITSVAECNSYTWSQTGDEYASSGLYYDTIPNAAGCDSIIVLDLTILQPTSSLTTITECDLYTWTNGTTYYSNGVYYDTLVGQNGCDSIAALDITLVSSSTASVSATSCGPFVWSLNNQTYTVSGFFDWTIPNAAGCDSVITLNLTVNTPPTATVIDLGNGTLQETSGMMISGWMDCSNNTVIPNSTSVYYTPTANGSYACIVVDGTNGCADTSDCFIVTNVGIEESAEIAVSIYPNPTNDLITVSFESSVADFVVYDAMGSVVHSGEVVSGETVSLKNLESGVYFITLKTELGSIVKQLIKQ